MGEDDIEHKTFVGISKRCNIYYANSIKTFEI